ncbi:MAG: hypothetical protein WBW88_09520 [Rhodothermales bacterium]
MRTSLIIALNLIAAFSFAQAPDTSVASPDSTYFYGMVTAKESGAPLEGFSMELYPSTADGADRHSAKLLTGLNGKYSAMIPRGHYWIQAFQTRYRDVYGTATFDRDTVSLNFQLELDSLGVDCGLKRYEGRLIDGEQDGRITYPTLDARTQLEEYACAKGFFTPDSLLDLIGPQELQYPGFPHESPWRCSDSPFSLYRDLNGDGRKDAVMLAGVPNCIRFVHCFTVAEGVECAKSWASYNPDKPPDMGFAEACFMDGHDSRRNRLWVQYTPSEVAASGYEVKGNRIYDDGMIVCGVGASPTAFPEVPELVPAASRGER